MMGKRRSRRRWGLVLLLLAAVGGAVLHWLWPGLRPVTSRALPAGTAFLFSVGNGGYPALQGVPLGPYSAPYPWRAASRAQPCRVHWLGDDGRPGRTPLDVHWDLQSFSWYPHYTSPRREVALGQRGGTLTLNWRDGRRQVRAVPAASRLVLRVMNPTATGYHADYDGARLFGPDGQRIALPDGYAVLLTLRSADPRYVVLTGQQHRVGIFDLSARRLVASPKSLGSRGMLFHHHGRFLILTTTGGALVLERGKTLYTYHGLAGCWRWGEDGTAWQVDGPTVKVLRWKTGACALAPLPVTLKSDERVADWLAAPTSWLGVFCPPPAPAVTLWDDGRYLACTETYRVLPDGTARNLERLTRLVGINRALPREARRLTLYRAGKVIGRYRIPVEPSALAARPTPGMLRGAASITIDPTHLTLTDRTGMTHTFSAFGSREHLAFTGDGHYLAWLLYTGKEVRHVVFPVR